MNDEETRWLASAKAILEEVVTETNTTLLLVEGERYADALHTLGEVLARIEVASKPMAIIAERYDMDRVQELIRQDLVKTHLRSLGHGEN